MQAVLGPQLWTVPQAHCAAVASALAPSVLARCASGAGKMPVDQPHSSAPDILHGEQGDGLNEACEVDSLPHVFSAQCIVPAGVDNDAVKCESPLFGVSTTGGSDGGRSDCRSCECGTCLLRTAAGPRALPPQPVTRSMPLCIGRRRCKWNGRVVKICPNPLSQGLGTKTQQSLSLIFISFLSRPRLS